MSRLGAAALLTLFTLSVPGTTLAQSVGDDQYRDPFAGQDQSGQQDDASAPAPAPTPAPTASAPATDPATGEPIATVADTLPRTGGEAGWVAGAGLFLIGAGAALRRTARA